MVLAAAGDGGEDDHDRRAGGHIPVPGDDAVNMDRAAGGHEPLKDDFGRQGIGQRDVDRRALAVVLEQQGIGDRLARRDSFGGLHALGDRERGRLHDGEDGPGRTAAGVGRGVGGGIAYRTPVQAVVLSDAGGEDHRQRRSGRQVALPAYRALVLLGAVRIHEGHEGDLGRQLVEQSDAPGGAIPAVAEGEGIGDRLARAGRLCRVDREGQAELGDGHRQPAGLLELERIARNASIQVSVGPRVVGVVAPVRTVVAAEAHGVGVDAAGGGGERSHELVVGLFTGVEGHRGPAPGPRVVAGPVTELGAGAAPFHACMGDVFDVNPPVDVLGGVAQVGFRGRGPVERSPIRNHVAIVV